MNPEFFKEAGLAVTVCDAEGKILYMNDKSALTFEKDGGYNLIGSNLLDCHPEPSKSRLAEMLQTQVVNTYTIEKNGVKKLIHQLPWYESGVFKGYIELSMVIPEKMPHFVRK